jgi:hypothetical protein
MKFTKESLHQLIAEEIERFLNENEAAAGDGTYTDDFWGHDQEEADEANRWIEELEEMSIKAFISLAPKLLEKNAELLRTPEGAKTLATRIMSKATPTGEAILNSPEVNQIRKFIYFSDKPALIRADMKNFQDEQAYLRKTLRALLGNIRASIQLPALVQLHQDLYPTGNPEGEDFDLESERAPGSLKDRDPPPSLEFPAEKVDAALEDFLQTDEYVPLTPTVLFSPEAMHKIAQRK